MRGLIALAALALAWGAPAAADTLIDNVKGLTATPFGQVIHFSALLIGDDGKVVRTYAEGEKVDVRARYRVDGRGRFLTPGRIVGYKAESHLIKMGLRLLARSKGLTGPLPPIGPHDRDLALAVAEEELRSRGITTIADMGTSVEDWLAYRRAGDTGRLNIRILSYVDGIAPMIAIAGGQESKWLYNDRLYMAGVLINGRMPNSNSPIAIKNDEARLRNEISRSGMDGQRVAIEISDSPKYDIERSRAEAAIRELHSTYRPSGTRSLFHIFHPPNAPEKLPIFVENDDFELDDMLIEDRLGKLERGFPADFAISLVEPWKMVPSKTDSTAFHMEVAESDNVLETWVGGVKVYERKP